MLSPNLLPALVATLLLLVIPCRAIDPSAERIVVLLSVDGLAHFYLDDPKAEMPTIRQLAAEGARVEKMRAVLPTVTWPIHTTLVTGVSPAKHGVVGNSFLDRTTRKLMPLIWDPLFDKEEIVRVPTIYDLAKRAGLKTAAVVWPGGRGAKSLDWTIPCVDAEPLYYAYATPSLWPELQAAGILYETEIEGFKDGKGRGRDRLNVQIFNHIVHTHRPNLALLHLLEVDHVEHAKGPQTPEAYDAVKFADEQVREVWKELQYSFPGKATLIVVSDHGFLAYRQLIQPNVVLRQEGLLTSEGKAITGGQVRATAQGGSSFVYVLDQANRDALIPRLIERFKTVEGIDLVIPPADFAKIGVADPATNPRMADIVLTAQEGYTFSDALTGDLIVTPPSEQVKGTHGYDPDLPPLHATFVAWGAGIKPGARLGTIRNTDVAPTAAALLGVAMPDIEGRPLETILAR